MSRGAVANERVQKRVWVIEYLTSEGWKPSFDYPFPWRTRMAARKKLKEIGMEIYRIACYERRGELTELGRKRP